MAKVNLKGWVCTVCNKTLCACKNRRPDGGWKENKNHKSCAGCVWEALDREKIPKIGNKRDHDSRCKKFVRKSKKREPSFTWGGK